MSNTELVSLMMFASLSVSMIAVAVFLLKKRKNSPKSSTVAARSMPSGTSPSGTSPSGTSSPTSGGSSTSGCPAGWAAANGSIYSSWPMPGSQECVKYEGCRWAGQFSAISATGSGGKCASGAAKISGGNGTPKECRFTPETVKSMRVASTTVKDFARLKGKKVEVFIEGRPQVKTTVTIRDNCNDKDCKDDNCSGTYSGCCSKNSDNGKYLLLDLEASAGASDLLGIDLTKKDVGGPFQENELPEWALNKRPGLPACVGGSNTLPLCYRVVP